MIIQIKRLLGDTEVLQSARNVFRQSVLMMKLIDAITVKNVTDTRALVNAVYGTIPVEQYPKFENRFYKLRKKLLDALEAGRADTSVSVFHTEEEKALAQCKQLLADGNFALAERQLGLLEIHCKERNIFEILPHIYEHLIQAKQALNKLKETPKVFEKYAQSLELFSTLGRMKILSRKIYEVNVISGIAAADSLFRQMDKLSRQHPGFPRFKLIYNFAAAYYKAGSASESKLIKTNVISRHLKVVKSILQQHPEMPVVNYTHDYKRTQNFRLRDLEAIIAFKAFRFKESARVMNTLLEDVIAPGSEMKKMLSNSLIVNTIHANVAAGMAHEAYKTAQFYIQFVRTNKLNEQLNKAFCELANVVATLRFHPPNISLQSLLKSINQLEQDVLNAKAEKGLGTIRFLKMQFVHFLGDEPAAADLANDAYVKAHISNQPLFSLMKKILQLQADEQRSEEKLQAAKHKLTMLKHTSVRPEDVVIFNWLSCILQEKEI